MMMRPDFESSARNVRSTGKNRPKVISKLVVDYSSCS